jgi:hypothetical protein
MTQTPAGQDAQAYRDDVTDDTVVEKGARLADRLARALQDAGIQVVSKAGGTVIDDKRGGTFAAGTVTLSPVGAEALVQKLTDKPIGDRDPGDAVRSALYARRIGGIVGRDPEKGNVGLASVTEGVVTALIEAIA